LECAGRVEDVLRIDRFVLGTRRFTVARMRQQSGRVPLAALMEERSTEEIASRLAMQPGNVRVLRHRALAAVRRCLDAREGAQP
jgi:DNA-directed RNA polymerase specialized sigma24 family protein